MYYIIIMCEIYMRRPPGRVITMTTPNRSHKPKKYHIFQTSYHLDQEFKIWQVQ